MKIQNLLIIFLVMVLSSSTFAAAIPRNNDRGSGNSIEDRIAAFSSELRNLDVTSCPPELAALYHGFNELNIQCKANIRLTRFCSNSPEISFEEALDWLYQESGQAYRYELRRIFDRAIENIEINEDPSEIMGECSIREYDDLKAVRDLLPVPAGDNGGPPGLTCDPDGDYQRVRGDNGGPPGASRGDNGGPSGGQSKIPVDVQCMGIEQFDA